MVSGQIKNQIDQIWDTHWTGGGSTPITIHAQMTYPFFMKMLDDGQIRHEGIANSDGEEVHDPTFDYGSWANRESGLWRALINNLTKWYGQ